MRRSISFLLIVAILVTSLNINVAHGQSYTIGEIAESIYSSEDEKLLEVLSDEESRKEGKPSAGDWKQARKDGIAYNYFHNVLQEELVSVGNVVSEDYQKEYYISFVKRTIGKAGPGRADIVKVDNQNNKIEVWEVKPYSYVDAIKRIKAQTQLNDYVNAIMADGKNKGFLVTQGSPAINGKSQGEIYVTQKTNIVYVISYYIEPDGLIFYKFVRTEYDDNDEYNKAIALGRIRDDRKDEDRKDEVRNEHRLPGAAMVYTPSTSYALEVLVGDAIYIPIPESMQNQEVDTPDIVMSEDTSETTETENPKENIFKNTDPKEDITEIDLKPFVPFVFLAVELVAIHSLVQLGERTRNSMSAEVLAAATTFIAMLKAELGDKMYQKLVRAGQGKKEDLTYRCSVSKAQMLENILADFDEIILAVGAEELVEDVLYMAKEKDKENIRRILNAIIGEEDEYNRASKQVMPKDPLVIDLGEPGINITTLEDGVNFDLDNNGFAEKIEWINDDGFLVIDRNNNQKIDNGTELFTDGITLQTGEKAKTGFEMLAEYDDNKDGKIDENDVIYPKLQVWVDIDQNGISSPDELKSLTSLGVESIAIAEDGEVRYTEDKESTVIKEMWFNARTAKTIKNGYVTFGNVEELTTYIFENNDTQTYEDLKSFAKATDITHKRYYARKILYTITGADKIEKISYGKNLDSRQLRVIECFMGRAYEGADGAVPNAKAAEILSQIYDRLEDNYYILLCSYAGSMSTISLLSSNMDMLTQVGEKLDEVTLYDTVLFLKSQSYLGDESRLNETLEYLSTFAGGKKVVNIIETSKIIFLENNQGKQSYTTGNLLLIGSACNDEVEAGNYDDEIFTGNGNDIIYGGEGNDILEGSTGNDILWGGTGEDTYIFNIGDGEDVIDDYAPQKTEMPCDRIIFTEGITPESLNLYRKDANLIIEYGTSDKITIKNMYLETKGDTFIEYIEFADGTVWDCNDIGKNSRKQYGTNGNDTLYAYKNFNGYDINEIKHGLKGNDIIYGDEGDDELYGDEGNDELYGGEGDDILEGSTGNDILWGGAGEDTYIFNIGDGEDVIDDYAPQKTEMPCDRIIFTEGITPESLNIYRKDANLIIEYGTSDKITIKNMYLETKGDSLIEYIEFSDGTIWDVMKDLEL